MFFRRYLGIPAPSNVGAAMPDTADDTVVTSASRRRPRPPDDSETELEGPQPPRRPRLTPPPDDNINGFENELSVTASENASGGTSVDSWSSESIELINNNTGDGDVLDNDKESATPEPSMNAPTEWSLIEPEFLRTDYSNRLFKPTPRRPLRSVGSRTPTPSSTVVSRSRLSLVTSEELNAHAETTERSSETSHFRERRSLPASLSEERIIPSTEISETIHTSTATVSISMVSDSSSTTGVTSIERATVTENTEEISEAEEPVPVSNLARTPLSTLRHGEVHSSVITPDETSESMSSIEEETVEPDSHPPSGHDLTNEHDEPPLTTSITTSVTLDSRTNDLPEAPRTGNCEVVREETRTSSVTITRAELVSANSAPASARPDAESHEVDDDGNDDQDDVVVEVEEEEEEEEKEEDREREEEINLEGVEEIEEDINEKEEEEIKEEGEENEEIMVGEEEEEDILEEEINEKEKEKEEEEEEIKIEEENEGEEEEEEEIIEEINKEEEERENEKEGIEEEEMAEDEEEEKEEEEKEEEEIIEEINEEEEERENEKEGIEGEEIAEEEEEEKEEEEKEEGKMEEEDEDEEEDEKDEEEEDEPPITRSMSRARRRRANRGNIPAETSEVGATAEPSGHASSSSTTEITTTTTTITSERSTTIHDGDAAGEVSDKEANMEEASSVPIDTEPDSSDTPETTAEVEPSAEPLEGVSSSGMTETTTTTTTTITSEISTTHSGDTAGEVTDKEPGLEEAPAEPMDTEPDRSNSPAPAAEVETSTPSEPMDTEPVTPPRRSREPTLDEDYDEPPITRSASRRSRRRHDRRSRPTETPRSRSRTSGDATEGRRTSRSPLRRPNTVTAPETPSNPDTRMETDETNVDESPPRPITPDPMTTPTRSRESSPEFDRPVTRSMTRARRRRNRGRNANETPTSSVEDPTHVESEDKPTIGAGRTIFGEGTGDSGRRPVPTVQPDKPDEPKPDTRPAEEVDPELEEIDPPEELGDLKFKEIDLQVVANRFLHRTDDYDNGSLIVRRGDDVKCKVTVNETFDKETDTIVLKFLKGPKPKFNKQTLVVIRSDQKDKVYKSHSWKLSISDVTDNVVSLAFTPDVDALIGRYRLMVQTERKKNDGKIQVCRKKIDEEVILLFNAFNKEDDAYIEDKEAREEFVMNETGLIYFPGLYGRDWNYGQFEEGILETALFLLEERWRDSKTKTNLLGNARYVLRIMSALVNAQFDEGILVGNWSGDYSGGVSPGKWVGSVKILQQYLQTKKPVKYGQCWVFGGVLTTLCRAIGIGTRTITNFGSAHDTDESCTIDVYFNEDGEKVEHMNNDSTWNFHVWNEAWISRPDLQEGYGGWQAFDATPQELSQGDFQCGPCPVSAVSQGNVGVDWDGKFIFSEVNADKVFWQVTDDGDIKPIKIDHDAVGYDISTKAVGKRAREDLTNKYKPKEGSVEERKAALNAMRVNRKNWEKIVELAAYDEYKMDVHFELVAKVDFNSNCHFEVIITNTSSEERKIKKGVLHMYACYNVDPAREKLVPSKNVDGLTIAADGKDTVTWDVKAEDYFKYLDDDAGIQFSAFFSVEDTGQTWTGVKNTVVNKPDLTVTVDKTKLEKGEDFEVTVSFENTINVTLNGIEVDLEGPGLTTEKDLDVSNTLGPWKKMEKTVKLTARKPGYHAVVASFKCKEIQGITGMATVHVKGKEGSQ